MIHIIIIIISSFHDHHCITINRIIPQFIYQFFMSYNYLACWPLNLMSSFVILHTTYVISIIYIHYMIIYHIIWYELHLLLLLPILLNYNYNHHKYYIFKHIILLPCISHLICSYCSCLANTCCRLPQLLLLLLSTLNIL